MKIIVIAACALGIGAAGCASHYKILSVPAMSMTIPSIAPGTTATAAGHAEAEYCPGDAPIVSKDSNVGLIDEAVAKAQQQSGAKYLSDVTVSRDGNCIFVEGTAMK